MKTFLIAVAMLLSTAAYATIPVEIRIDSDKTKHQLRTRLDRASGDNSGFIKGVQNYLKAIAGGVEHGVVKATVDGGDGEYASATFAFDTAVEDDAVTVGAVTITLKDSPSGENQSAVGAQDGITVSNLVTKINAHSVLSSFVTASVDGSTTTTLVVKSNVAGVIGNSIACSETGSTITASGSFLAGGVEPGSTEYRFGL